MIKAEGLAYSDGGVALKGFVAYDDGKTNKRPGVLVMPEAFGLGKNAKRRAQMLAELGKQYAGFQADRDDADLSLWRTHPVTS